MSKLIRLLGLRTGNLLNVKNLASDIGIDQRTIARYIQLLELTFQINQLIPWHVNSHKRFVKTPKIYANDSGYACYLAGINDPDHLENHSMWVGLLETWVWAEIRKQLAMTSGIESFFYRTHLGREVDFVLEKGVRRWGIEVKSTRSVTRSDFSGLLDFQDAAGSNAKGVIFYLGDSIVNFSKTLLAAPLSCLLF
jgi:predicted AAA+ superfamily ATPase